MAIDALAIDALATTGFDPGCRSASLERATRASMPAKGLSGRSLWRAGSRGVGTALSWVLVWVSAVEVGGARGAAAMMSDSDGAGRANGETRVGGWSSAVVGGVD